jgi:hypothetical protein
MTTLTPQQIERARALTAQIMNFLPLLPYGTSDHIETIIDAALREASAEGLEEAAKIAEGARPILHGNAFRAQREACTNIASTCRTQAALHREPRKEK